MRRVMLSMALGCAGVVVGIVALAQPLEEAKSHYEAGVAAKQAKDYDKARVELNQAIKLEKDYLEAHWVLAWVYIARKENDVAGERFRQVIRIAPDSEKGREAKAALERMDLGVTPKGAPSTEGTSATPAVAGQTSEHNAMPSDEDAECPTFMSNGTALLDAATVAKLVNGSWEHSASEIIIKADPEVHCPFGKKEFHTADKVYATSAGSLYFSWLDVGLVPTRVLTLYGWHLQWDGPTNTITVSSSTETHAFRILTSTEFFAKYRAAPLPTLPSGPGIGYSSASGPGTSHSSQGGTARAASEREIYAALVRAEDRFGVSRMEEARNSICRKYRITRKQLDNIAVKALMNQWPVPEGPRPGTAAYRQMLR